MLLLSNYWTGKYYSNFYKENKNKSIMRTIKCHPTSLSIDREAYTATTAGANTVTTSGTTMTGANTIIDEEHGECCSNRCRFYSPMCKTESWYNTCCVGEIENKTLCWIFTLFAITAIIVCSCVALSFHYVSYDQYALKRDVYGSVDGSTVYTQGRYFMTLNYDFVYFDSTYQQITFDSTIFTDNGLESDIYMSFFFSLPEDNVSSIYNTYSNSYSSKVISNSKQTAKNVASTFSVDEFINNRSYVEQTICKNIQDELLISTQTFAPSKLCKITSVIFPLTVISTSLDTAIALQNNEVQEYQQGVDLINADTTKIIASISAETNKTLLFATNIATQLVKNSESQAFKIVSLARSNGTELLCSTLGITDPLMKEQVVKIFAIADNQNNYTMFNNLNSLLISP
jgi:hypothetical protein